MSIEQKIAQLMEQAKQLESSDEVVSIEEETAEESLNEGKIEYHGTVQTKGGEEKEWSYQVGEHAGSHDRAIKKQNPHLTPQEHEAVSNHPNKEEETHEITDKKGNVHNIKTTINGREGRYVESVSTKIDLGTLFEGEEFSAEFKSKAGELFEAAVEARIKQEIAKIEEEVSQRVVTESAELKEGLVDKVDGYLDYVVEQWMQKNELALDRGIKVEIFESFVSGMKDLFETHYIDVPEEKFDLMESVDAKAKTLEEQVDFLTAQNVELQQKFKLVAKEKQIEEACKELTDLEAERFKQLAEELAYDDEESFGKKLELVKENYISKAKQAKTVVVESVVTDSPVELIEEKQVDASMARYMHAFKAR